MSRILITGARGLLGSALTKHLMGKHILLPADRKVLDITDRKAVDLVVGSFKPDLIVNCAAMARVDICETETEQARAVNSDAAGYLAEAAERVGAEIMHVSTDYVFDGKSDHPYTCEDEPNPISAYGHSKLLGEVNVANSCSRHYIVRVVRLFALHGENFGSRIFHAISSALEKGTPLKVFPYPVSQATYIPDLVARMMEIASLHDYGIYHLTGSGRAVGWPEFVLKAAEVMGRGIPGIELVTYEQLGLQAQRPRYTGLRCLKSEQLGLAPMRRWDEALAAMYEEWMS